MDNASYIPERGDLVWLILDPRTGHEQSGRRPVLVISSHLLTKHTGLALICPVTSKVKGLPFEINLKGCKTEGAILPIHLRSVDIRARKPVFIEKIPQATVEKVSEYINLLINQE